MVAQWVHHATSQQPMPRWSTGRNPAAVRVRAEQATQEKKGDSAARQLLGMKGASAETDIWKIRVQLTKPVTWIPLIWGGWQ